MSGYIISVLISAVCISVIELVIPKGKLKGVISFVVSVVFIGVMVAPIMKTDISGMFDFDFDVLDPRSVPTISAVDEEIEKYYENTYKKALFDDNLIAEKVVVETSGNKIEKVDIYLSNLVIDEKSEHINSNVIRTYISSLIGVPYEKVEVYV
ncbi:MAG: hypothetical protein IJ706_09885 [Clostridia bacterium]|nr:hypothetical protein [Clostridia bacterium]